MSTFIVTLMVVLIVLTLLHIIYENAILPTVRTCLRFNLFTLRDELRRLKNEQGDDFEPEAYRYLQESINSKITYISLINLKMIFDCHRAFKDRPDIVKRANNRDRIVRECKIEEFHRIRTKSLKILVCIIVANCAGFFISFIPVFLLALTITMILGKIQYQFGKVKHFIINLFFVPEKEMLQVAPLRKHKTSYA